MRRNIVILTVGFLVISGLSTITLSKEAKLELNNYDIVTIAPTEFSNNIQPLIDHKNNHDVKTILKTTDMNTSQLINNPLIISTFLGGGENDGHYYTGVNLIQDKQGNVFIAGTTESTDFPITSGVYSEEHNGNSDLFVTKMKNDLTEVLASTYIGGSNNEEARGIEIDQNGNIFVCGITESSDFPVTTNALQDEYHGGTESPYGSGDAFIVKLNNDLTEVISSTFLGGSGHESLSSIAMDSTGNIVVAGSTSSSDFPVSESAYDTTYDSGGYIKDDVFVSKLTNDLSEMISSTYIGGDHDDFSEAISIDSSNAIFIAGWTRSSTFPTTIDAYDRSFSQGYYDGFISQLNEDFTSLISSTYIGGSQWDFCYALTLDNDENVYVSGHTASLNYPTTSNAYCKNYQGVGGPNEGDDAFISKLSNNLSLLLASTYLGGDNWEMGYSLISSGNDLVYVSGTTSSFDFPTINSFDDAFHGGAKHYGDIFISCFNNELSMLPASTYLGGTGDENAGQVLSNIDGEIIVAGSSSSLDFPIIGDGYDSTHNGNADIFISKFKSGLTDNQPPEKPILSGSTSGKAGTEYEYTITSVDPEGHDIYYLIDWGDNTSTEWLGLYDSGEEIILSHIWAEQGNYTIKSKAKDIYGLESNWATLEVSMPKNKIINPFERFLENHPYIFPMLRQLLGL